MRVRSVEARERRGGHQPEGDVLQPAGEVGQVATDEAAQPVAHVGDVEDEHLGER